MKRDIAPTLAACLCRDARLQSAQQQHQAALAEVSAQQERAAVAMAVEHQQQMAGACARAGSAGWALVWGTAGMGCSAAWKELHARVGTLR